MSRTSFVFGYFEIVIRMKLEIVVPKNNSAEGGRSNYSEITTDTF